MFDIRFQIYFFNDIINYKIKIKKEVINMIDDRLRLMQSIINFLNECTYYYDIGNPIISDKEYDDRYFDLQKLEKDTGIIMSNSPTNHIPYEVKNELTKVIIIILCFL